MTDSPRLVRSSALFMPEASLTAARHAARAYPAVDQDRVTTLTAGGFPGACDAVRSAMGPGVPVAAVAVDLLWRIWSECYLGRRLFESVWSEPPRFVDADGAIYREQLVTDRSALDRHWPAGSGTTWLAERARHEALVLMSLHGLAGRFERIIWDGDCRQPPDVSTFRRDSSAAI